MIYFNSVSFDLLWVLYQITLQLSTYMQVRRNQVYEGIRSKTCCTTDCPPPRILTLRRLWYGLQMMWITKFFEKAQDSFGGKLESVSCQDNRCFSNNATIVPRCGQPLLLCPGLTEHMGAVGICPLLLLEDIIPHIPI